MRTMLVSAVVAAGGLLAVGCGGSDDAASSDEVGFVGDVRAAVEAVENELGEGQEFFEVTANPQVTNVFVAVDDATAAIPYVYIDGELEPPAPTLRGASGFTFTASDIVFDEGTVLDRIADELPDATVLALSVEGVDGGGVRYMVSTQSAQGGALDVEVGPDGTVFAVDPI